VVSLRRIEEITRDFRRSDVRSEATRDEGMASDVGFWGAKVMSQRPYMHTIPAVTFH
jgi:hypothetical protein